MSSSSVNGSAQIRATGTNRTAEFLAAVESIRLKSASQPGASQRLLNSNKANAAAQRSEFARHALQISKDLQSTTAKLEKLALLAKRKTMFDDKPVEISELSYIIKRDIASLNSQIANLQALRAKEPSPNSKKPQEEHNNNVVLMLQGRLANTSIGFKDVLEIRTQNMKASRERGQVFGTSSSASAGPSQPNGYATGPSSDSPLYAAVTAQNRQQNNSSPFATSSAYAARGLPNGDLKGKGKENDFLALDMGGGSSSTATTGHGTDGNMQQMQLIEQEDTYLASRSTAIESIESTIAELGQIFSQLATMVAQQGETVQRIDADTSDIANNIGGAQQELLRYYTNISGNRMLMLKLFGVLMVFFLLFVLIT